MKNVIIFSSLTPTKKMCKRMKKHIHNGKIGYIPAGFWDSGFYEKPAYYKSMGFNSVVPFPVGKYYNENKRDELFSCDAIRLGGGNTFEFLMMLRARNMLEPLREYVKNGGVLMGTSAGGIMMCEQIRIAGFADPNFLGLTNLKSLGFVNFEVKPHWDYWVRYKDEFQKYVNAVDKTLYCLREGQSIWVTDNGIKFYGGMPEKLVKKKGWNVEAL